MSLLTRDEKQRLIGLLLQLPNINNPEALRLLVADLPTGLQNSIDLNGSAVFDVPNIVRTVDSDAWARLPDGSWGIISVIQNAIALVQGAQTGQDLQQLLDILKTRATQPPVPTTALTDLAATVQDRATSASAAPRAAILPIPLLMGGGLGVLALAVVLGAVLPGLVHPSAGPPTPQATTSVPPAPTSAPPTVGPAVSPSSASATVAATAGNAAAAFDEGWGQCVHYYVIPFSSNIDPTTSPVAALTALTTAYNNHTLASWPQAAIAGSAVLPNGDAIPGFNDRARLTGHPAAADTLLFAASVELFVKVQPPQGTHADVIEFNQCNAENPPQFFSTAALAQGRTTYTQQITTTTTLRLRAGEAVQLLYTFLCQDAGVYNVTVTMPYSSLLSGQPGQVRRISPELVCPLSYTLWDGNVILNAGSSRAAPRLVALGNFVWDAPTSSFNPQPVTPGP